MGLIQTSRQSAGGSGSITGFNTDVLVQTTNFISGEVVITLTDTPFDTGGITVDYNGQTLYTTSWSYAAGAVTILFADPYVTTYDENPVFQVHYPY